MTMARKCGTVSLTVPTEIEVSKLTSWGPDADLRRGLKLLKFMEKRWGISFSSDQAKESILFLPD